MEVCRFKCVHVVIKKKHEEKVDNLPRAWGKN